LETSYKNKLRLVRDEQFNNPLNDKEKLKMISQKGLLIIIAISMIIYLSNIL